ncbi:tRNA uracil 4-sulfurtransferase ThiI [Anaerobacillus sp. MEB173]|uniref:tRNA uracil 4-sulfurtransferase ThiI n=1 Tax=Anaerobacillus sp. MEB173 TaxID=3383345 RepID=UPI003F9397B0
MKYDHILIRYGELALKGKNRSQFEKQLQDNIKIALKGHDNLKIQRTYGRMFIELNGEPHEEVVEKLQHVFGIHSFSLAIKVSNELDTIKEGALKGLLEANPNAKTFKVSAKRAFKNFPIGSQDLNQHVGGYILANTENITVDVHNPDVEVKVEVREVFTYITCAVYRGAGGLPVGSGGKVMLMLSGGIDSPVAGYLAMKRGVKIEAIHFHSPPYTNERAKQKVEDLVRILTKFGGKIKLHIVPFTNIQLAIHQGVPSNYEITIMRRIMMRISEQLAANNNALAIATGESLGQVASQTLSSMNTINEVTNLPIIRPLVTMDKLEVIDIAQKIGTYETSILPYEDCCTIFLPQAPKTKPNRAHANKYEQNLDIEQLIAETIENTETVMFKPHENLEKTMEDLF